MEALCWCPTPLMHRETCRQGWRVQADLRCSCRAVGKLSRAATCQITHTGRAGALMARANGKRNRPAPAPTPSYAPCSLALFQTACLASLATIPTSHCFLRGSLVASRWGGRGQNKSLRSQRRAVPLPPRASRLPAPANPTAPNSFQCAVGCTLIPLPQLLLEPNGLGAEYHIKRLPACEKTTNNKYCELHAL